MKLRELRAKLNASASGPPLDPPATPAELSWWRQAKKPIRRRDMLRNGLLVQLPIWLGSGLKNGLHHFLTRSDLLFTLGLGVSLAAITGWLTWASVREVRMRSAIVGKRLREGILNPPEAELNADGRQFPLLPGVTRTPHPQAFQQSPRPPA